MQRQERITQWLGEIFGRRPSLSVASADASFRRYFRTEHDGVSYIVMDAPPDKEPLEPFAGLSAHFRAHGLNTPEIFAKNETEGFLLLTDFGSICYLDVLDADSVETLYPQAIEALITLQNISPAPLPPYDATRLYDEMALFTTWYLGEHLQVFLSQSQAEALQQVFDLLVESALAQPVVSVHRDYHSRNLMLTETNNPGVIDFQDAMAGPISYDLVSLLKDCYIRWPTDKVARWRNDYYAKMQDVIGVDKATFVQWFDYMGVQRHLKAIGIFARLNYRDGKPGYMGDIPRVMHYVQDMAEAYPALQVLGDLCIVDEHCI